MEFRNIMSIADKEVLKDIKAIKKALIKKKILRDAEIKAER